MSITLPKISGYVTGEQCLQYVSRNIGLLSYASYDQNEYFLNYGFNDMSIAVNHVYASDSDSPASSNIYLNKDITKMNNDTSKKIVGLILDENDDGSFKVAILGNDTIENVNIVNIKIRGGGTSKSSKIEGAQSLWESDIEPVFVYAGDGASGVYNYTLETNQGSVVPLENVFDFTPTLSTMDSVRGTLLATCKQGNTSFDPQRTYTYRITNDKTTTLTCGNAFDINPLDRWLAFEFLRENSPYGFMSGNFYEFLEWYHGIVFNHTKKFTWAIEGANFLDIVDPPDFESVGQLILKHSLQTVPVNLILTYNESFASAYLQNGTLPPDAFLYPLDWSNFPTVLPSGDDDDETSDEPNDDDTNDENNPSGIEGSPTVDGDPQTTTSKVNNNNVYWLQIGQLTSFINWFWTQAGEIIDLDDLWNRITGLYNDLGSAVINVRYFPVNKNYIGGTSQASSVIVGMIEYAMNCEILNKANPTKIILGTQSIPEKYNAFTDYSPYTELQLYLPFHGWMALDVDIFMGNSVRVKAVYDYMSGTCQYLIYVVANNNEYLVNTCEVKMAVDIPITLQSKNDRDSAIFSNVTSAMGNLIGAGASVATMNPIGLVMSTANSVASGANSAPMKMLGTQGENGAFYAPNKCAIYLKRPTYNRPKVYESRVGYPCNKGLYLGESPNNETPAKGFTTCYNPTITFKGNNLGGKYVKPLASEIEEIYDYLEKGVIL